MHFLIALFAVSFSFGAGTSHGIRNTNCAPDESDARFQIFEKIRTDKTLCRGGLVATQTGGWSCHLGRECPKGKVRCNTQYLCGKAAPSELSAKTPATEITGTAKKNRELKNGDQIFIEETVTDADGVSTTVVRPRTAKDYAAEKEALKTAPKEMAVAKEPDEKPAAPVAPEGTRLSELLAKSSTAKTADGESFQTAPMKISPPLMKAIASCDPFQTTLMDDSICKATGP